MKTIVAQDQHAQYQDEKTWELFLDFVKREKPDQIILNGDFMDFYKISSFDKDPARTDSLQDEINVGYNLLFDIRAVAGKDCDIQYNKGNHEDRLRRWIWKNPDIHSLDCLDFVSLMDLDSLDIKFNEEGVYVGKMYITHGSIVRKHAGYTARAEFEKNGCSGMSGHTHRDGKYTVKNRNGHFVWFENFCMCDLDAEYIDGVANWTQGWSVIHTIGDRQYVEQIPVINHSYIYKGKEWK